MITREIVNRLKEITKWKNIPKKDKNKKILWIYFEARPGVRAKNSRKYMKALFIAYQEEKGLKEMCKEYTSNVLLRFPGKKYTGKDKIYVDSEVLSKTTLNKMAPPPGRAPINKKKGFVSKKKSIKKKQ